MSTTQESMMTGFLLFFSLLMALQYYRLAVYKKHVTSQYITEQNSASVFQRNYFSFFVRTVCIVVSWLLLTICLTKLADLPKSLLQTPDAPSLQTLNAKKLPIIDEIAFILDLSASMGAKDTSDGQQRLTKAKEIISGLIENLGGINASLTGFAGNSQTVVPDTLDYLYFRILMDSTGINDTQEAGTNLLAMIDSVKAKYANSPYRKSVRLVLLTDGEDTGFLEMSETSRKQAEVVLLEHLSQTVSATLQWQIIGLGSDAGAQVPDVTYKSQPVVSKMNRALLENMAKAGGGHFYAEVDAPVTAICDDLLADIAVSKTGLKDRENDYGTFGSYAPRITREIFAFLIAALLLLVASITLPQYEKRGAL